MPRNRSEIASDDREAPCCPSAWWVKCQDCGRMFVSVIHLLDLMCMDCYGPCESIDNGAVWGFEWKTVLALRAYQARVDRQSELLAELRRDNQRLDHA